MIDFTGKNIIVTGAASGIGKATVHLLNNLGARCFRFDLNEEGLNQDNLSLEQNPIYAVDLTDFDAVSRVMNLAKNTLFQMGWGNGFHGLVHCAGIPSILPLRILQMDDYERVQKINTQAGLNLAKIFSKNGMYDKQQRSSIVFISSVYGLVGSAANVAYAISKGANISMTKALAVELAPKNIRVNCIAPGFVKTNMGDKVTPLFDEGYSNRIEKMHLLGWGEPEDIANGIVFLLSDAAKWITGTVVTIDGGFTAQ